MDIYEEYKDSGIDWVGKVPASWKRSRIKFLLSHSSAGVWGEDEKGNKDDIVCFRAADFDYSHGCLKLDNNTVRNIQPKQLEGRVLHKRDLLIEKSGGGDATPVGRIVRFNYDGIATCSNFMHFISVNKNNDDNYLFYYFYAMYPNNVNVLYFNHTTGIQNLKVSEYLGQIIFIPSLKEQSSISSYLDKKCSEIDNVISAQQKRIALLQELKQSVITHAVTKGLDPNVEMKDSGVEWIGKVPTHWELIRTRYLCNLCTGNKDTINRVDDGKYPFYVRSPKVERINTYSFDGEAILMAGDGVGAGKVFHYAKGKFDYHQRVYNFHNFKRVIGKFFFHYIANNFRYIIEEGGAKNTVDSVRLYMIQNFLMTVPTIEEQYKICEYIEQKEMAFDTAISKAQHQVELLQEYKQSLITEVVTGKRKVS